MENKESKSKNPAAPQGEEQSRQMIDPNTNLPDTPGQALESGEPGETGRSHGEIIEKTGEPAAQQGFDQGHQNAPVQPGDEDLEAGRHQANL